MPSPAAVTPASLRAADKAGAPVKTPTCHTAVMLSDLPLEVQARINVAFLSDPTRVKTTAIVAVLHQHGLPARAENVSRHRRRMLGVGNYGCKCPRLSEAPA